MFRKPKDVFSPDSPAGKLEWLIAGLGNPGGRYENTRHNAGFIALDAIAGHTGVKINRLKFKSSCADCLLGGKRVLLLKPSTFMNLSGEAVRDAMEFYKLPPQRLLVISDDVTKDAGHLRIRRKGSDGGHNGLKNIIYLLGSDEFPRIRIGVGQKPHEGYDLADWVLSRFTEKELESVKSAADCCVQAAALIVQGNIDEAMNRFSH